MPEVGKRSDPYGAFNFLVEIEGIIEGGFTEVSGLSIQTEYDTVKEGGNNSFEHKLPKGTKYTDITLKRGITDWELYDWYQDVINGKIERKSGSIYLIDSSGERVMEWDFLEAFPVKWDGPAFNAGSNAIATETLVLAHHGLI
jgi:phage tail-like protein